MHTIKNDENTPASVAISYSLGGPWTKSTNRSQSPSPSPAPIRKSRPFQSLNSNQVFRRQLGDDKENQRPNHSVNRPSGVRLDQSTVILQPPHLNLSSEVPQSQSALHDLSSKPTLQQVQLGLIPLSNQWNSNQNCGQNGRIRNVAETQWNPTNFSSYTQREMEGPDVDPFAQLSARTLALMDQPESEVTIYDCEYCDKTYQGKHARSIWRRHLSDKHKIPLATQPRRTRWDNDANRPKTEEERRERTLESKRRWARKNRAAKKAVREGQKNSIDRSVGSNHPQSVVSEPHRASPSRSRAPSPSTFPISLGRSVTGSLQYCQGTGQLGRSEHRGQLSGMTRGSSAPHAFSPYPSIAPRASLPFRSSSFNAAFCMPQIVPGPEWAFPMACSINHSPYSFESMTPSAHSPVQFSDRFPNQGLPQNHSPSNFHNLNRRHSLTAYASETNHQQLDERRELPQGYLSASSTSRYGDWESDGRINIPSALPVNLAQLEEPDYETQFKRPRLSPAFAIPAPLQQCDDLQKPFSKCHLDGIVDNRDFQSIEIQEMRKSSVSSSDTTAQVSFKTSPATSMREEEADSELGAIAEEQLSPVDGQDDFRLLLNSPTDSQNRVDDVQPARPATSGTLSSMSRDNEAERVIPMNRAATEPQAGGRYDLQTPSLPRMDSTITSIHQGPYPPLNTGKRGISDSMQIQPLGAPGSLSMGDWNNHALDTSPGFSRFPFSNVLSSPAGSAGLFGSPHNYLSKSLGLTYNGSAHNEDGIGGFLEGAASTWDMVHQRAS